MLPSSPRHGLKSGVRWAGVLLDHSTPGLCVHIPRSVTAGLPQCMGPGRRGGESADHQPRPAVSDKGLGLRLCRERIFTKTESSETNIKKKKEYKYMLDRYILSGA